jgi:hypothetical protein
VDSLVETARPYFEKGEIEKYLEAQQTRLKTLRVITQKLATKKREVVIVKNKNDTEVTSGTVRDKAQHCWSWIGAYNRWHCKQCGAYARKRNHNKSCKDLGGPMGGISPHRTHQIHRLQRIDDGADILACMVCGYYSQLRSRGLGRPCPGHGMNGTHIRRLRNLQHPATPHIRLFQTRREASEGPADKMLEPHAGRPDGGTLDTQEQDPLHQLDEMEQEAALAEASTPDDDLTWGLCGPSEDEGYTDSRPERLQPHWENEEELEQETGGQGQGPEPQTALPWEDLYGYHRVTEPNRPTSQGELCSDILGELRELHQAGHQVVWPPGWHGGVQREPFAAIDVPSSQPTQPGPATATVDRTAAGNLELAELLDLHRDGILVAWPPGWNPVSAASALHESRACPVGPPSRPDAG